MQWWPQMNETNTLNDTKEWDKYIEDTSVAFLIMMVKEK